MVSSKLHFRSAGQSRADVKKSFRDGFDSRRMVQNDMELGFYMFGKRISTLRARGL